MSDHLLAIMFGLITVCVIFSVYSLIVRANRLKDRAERAERNAEYLKNRGDWANATAERYLGYLGLARERASRAEAALARVEAEIERPPLRPTRVSDLEGQLTPRNLPADVSDFGAFGISVDVLEFRWRVGDAPCSVAFTMPDAIRLLRKFPKVEDYWNLYFDGLRSKLGEVSK